MGGAHANVCDVGPRRAIYLMGDMARMVWRATKKPASAGLSAIS
jgi:hypothetical protein